MASRNPPSNAGNPAGAAIADVRCAQLGDYSLLHVGPGRLAVLDGAARRILEAAASGLKPAQIARRIAREQNGDFDVVHAHTVAFLRQLTKLKGTGTPQARAFDVTAFAAPRTVVSVGRARQHCYRIGRERFRIRYADRWEEALIHPLWASYETDDSGEEVRSLSVKRAATGVELSCRAGEAAVVHDSPRELKGAVVRWVTENLHGVRKWSVVLHAGAVGVSGAVYAFCAMPNSGKSTLVAALSHTGFSYFSDDCVPIGACDGLARSVPAAISVRQGSWRVLEPLIPALHRVPAQNREGTSVKYLPPPHAACTLPAPLRVGALFFSSYRPDVRGGLRQLGSVEALTRLLQTGSGIDETGGPAAVGQFARWLETTPAYELEYASLDEAHRLIRRVART